MILIHDYYRRMKVSNCKTCEEIGCPVEGMTGICSVCGREFCFGHLNNHKHKFTDIHGATNSLCVMGIGRVGSYVKAKESHRSRNHKYWVIGYFDNRDRTRLGYSEVEDSPHFKTKCEAETFFATLR